MTAIKDTLDGFDVAVLDNGNLAIVGDSDTVTEVAYSPHHSGIHDELSDCWQGVLND